MDSTKTGKEYNETCPHCKGNTYLSMNVMLERMLQAAGHDGRFNQGRWGPSPPSRDEIKALYDWFVKNKFIK